MATATRLKGRRACKIAVRGLTRDLARSLGRGHRAHLSIAKFALAVVDRHRPAVRMNVMTVTGDAGRGRRDHFQDAADMSNLAEEIATIARDVATLPRL